MLSLVALLAAGLAAANDAAADTIVVGFTCTETALDPVINPTNFEQVADAGEDGGPPDTIDQHQLCGIIDLENTAYDMWAESHGMQPGDPRIAATGQTDIVGLVWELLDQISYSEDNGLSSTLTADQKSAYAWLQSVVQVYDEAAAKDALAEYNDWSNNVCSYVPPNPTIFTFRGALDLYCSGTLGTLFSGPTPPTYAQFLNYGAYDANQAVSNTAALPGNVQTQFLEKEEIDESDASWLSVLTAPSAALAQAAIPGVNSSLVNTIFPNVASNKTRLLNRAARLAKARQVRQQQIDEVDEDDLAAEGADADEVIADTAAQGAEAATEGGVDAAAAIADAASAASAAVGAAFFVFGIAAALTTVEIQAIVAEDKIPSELQANVNASAATPDVGAMLADSNQSQLVEALFEDQLENISVPAPVTSGAPFDGSEFEVSYANNSGNTVYSDYEKTTQLETWPVGVDGGERGIPFSTFAYADGLIYGTPDPDQTAAGFSGYFPSGHLNYFDWGGTERTAFIDGDKFLDLTGPGSDDEGGADTGDYCQSKADECGLKSTIEALGPGGLKLRVTLSPDAGAAAQIDITNQAGDIANDGAGNGGLVAGQSVTLNDPQTNPSGLPATYTWQIETRCPYDPNNSAQNVQGVPVCPGSADYGLTSLPPDESDLTSGGAEDPEFHGDPVQTETGQSVSFTWPAPGTYHVRLITKDAYGISHETDRNVSVVDAGVSVPVSLGPTSQLAVIGPVASGTPVTITGCIESPDGAFANPNVSVNWGDGSSVSQHAEDSPTPALAFSFDETAVCSSSAWGFTATHTYSVGSSQQLPITITATDGFTASTTRDLFVNLTVTSKPAFVSADTATFTAGTINDFTIKATGTPTPKITMSGALPRGIGFSGGMLDGTTALGTDGGSYPLTFTATSSAGTSTQSFTLVVNSTPTITSPGSLTVEAGTSFSYAPQTGGYPSASSVTIDGALPAGVGIEHSLGSDSLGGTPAAGTAGTYPLAITASNSAGSTVQNFTLVVSAAPLITSLDSARFVTSAGNSFLVTTSGTPTAALSLTGTLPAGLNFLDNGDGTGKIFGVATESGTFPVTVSASNADGTATQNLTVTASSTGGPPIDSPDSTTFQTGTASSFTVHTSDPDATLSVEGTIPPGLTFTDDGAGSGSLAGDPTVTGTFGLAVTAADGPATSVQYLSVLVFGPPAFTSAPTATFEEGSPGTFTVTAPSNPVATIEAVGQSMPPGLTFTDNFDGSATISGTPSAGSAGTYSVTLTATSLRGTAQQQLTINIDKAPTITSAASAYVGTGTIRTIVVTTGGYPVPALTYSGTLGAGLTFTDQGNGSAIIAGSRTSTSLVTSSITVTAASSAGTTSQQLRLEYGPVPKVSSYASADFAVGQSGVFTVQASGSPAPAIIASTPLPDGLTLIDNHNGTATLSGTPSPAAGGTHDVTIEVSNPYGSSTQNLTITVAQAPSYTGELDATFSATSNPLEGDGWTLTTSGTPVAALSLTGVLPPGVSFLDHGDGTASITGAATPGSAGTYPLTLTMANAVGTTTASLLLTVNETAQITSPLSATYVAGVPNSTTITTEGSPTPGFTLLSPSTLPSWLTFTDNGDGTATLRGTPPESAVGQDVVVPIFAQNGVPNGDLEGIDIIVSALGFTASTPPPATVGKYYAYRFTSSDPNATFGHQGTLPSGLSISKTGLLAGTPRVVGSVKFTILAADGGPAVSAPSSTFIVRPASHELEISQFRLVGPTGASDWYADLTNTTKVSVSLTGWRLALLLQGDMTPVQLELGTGSLAAGASILVAGPFFSAAGVTTPEITGPPLAANVGGMQVLAPDDTVTDRVGTVGAPASLIDGTGLPQPTALAPNYAYVRYRVSGALKNTGDNAADFVYEGTVPVATTTTVTALTQTSPTSATVRHGTAYSAPVMMATTSGAVAFDETASAFSTDVVVSSSGVVSTTATLPRGRYSVSGSVLDTNGDHGTWKVTLTVT